MLPRGARVTCYPGARVPHVTQGKAKQMKEKQRQAQQHKATQKQTKSNCDATRVTCYPRARVCREGEAKRLIGRRYLFLRARHEAVCTKLVAEVLLFCDD